jgi:hypothetical protein
MGCDQREQPLLGKEGIRPAVMVRAAASAKGLPSTFSAHALPLLFEWLM